MPSRMKKRSASRPVISRVAAFLRDAEPQFDSEEAREELVALLTHLGGKSNEITSNKATAFVTTIKGFLCSASALPLEAKDLEKELRSPSTAAAIRRAANKLRSRLGPLAFPRAVCIHHPGRPSTGAKFGKPFCKQCNDGIDAAVVKVDVHVEPKECFVTFKGGDVWDKMPGTGCAHWIAHQKNWSGGGTIRCLDEKKVKVSELVAGLATIARASVAKGDIWVQADLGHCGLVINVSAGSPNTITIRHDSSDQGGVVENDFDGHFGGRGSFKR